MCYEMTSLDRLLYGYSQEFLPGILSAFPSARILNQKQCVGTKANAPFNRTFVLPDVTVRAISHVGGCQFLEHGDIQKE